jgi:hypothetical protein
MVYKDNVSLLEHRNIRKNLLLITTYHAEHSQIDRKKASAKERHAKTKGRISSGIFYAAQITPVERARVPNSIPNRNQTRHIPDNSAIPYCTLNTLDQSTLRNLEIKRKNLDPPPPNCTSESFLLRK